MRSLFRKMHKGEKGFTLVELLVVFTLMGVLAGIMIPSVSSLFSAGEANASAMELSVIQTAMDTMMANEQVDSVTITAETNDMGSFPTGNVLYPNYLRFQFSTSNYSCSDTGLVSIETDNFAQ